MADLCDRGGDSERHLDINLNIKILICYLPFVWAMEITDTQQCILLFHGGVLHNL